MTRWRSLSAERGLHYRSTHELLATTVAIVGRSERNFTTLVEPDHPIVCDFYAARLPITIEVLAIEPPAPTTPARPRPARPPLLEAGAGDAEPPTEDPVLEEESGTHAAVVVTLTRAGAASPTLQWTAPRELRDGRRSFEVSALPAGDTGPVQGWWRVVVTPGGARPLEVRVVATAPVASPPIKTSVASLRLLRRVLALAVDIVAPSIIGRGGAIEVSISPELAHILGTTQNSAFIELPFGLNTKLRLVSTKLEAVRGQDVLDVLAARVRDVAATPVPAGAAAVHAQIVKHWRERLTAAQTNMRPDDLALRLRLSWIDPTVEGPVGLEVGSLDPGGEIFVGLGQYSYRTTPRPHVVALLGASVALVGDIDDRLAEVLTPMMGAAAGYVGQILARLAGRDATVVGATADATGWRIRSFVDVPRPDPDRPMPATVPTPKPPPPPPRGGGGIPTGDPLPAPAAGGPLGVFPSGFQVVDGGAVARLDRVKTLFVLMMENRSFDHLLGQLDVDRPGLGYDGMPAAASNPAAGGFGDRIRARPVRRVIRPGFTPSRIPFSPHHGHAAVMFQIGGGDAATAGSGQMQGFTGDVVDRTSDPHYVMSYNSLNDLPAYSQLAASFKVCDRWFSGLPGPTFPNRWLTLCGQTPELENFENDDPRLGYLELPTIFDVLTTHGIDWRYFESDLSIMRMFDRYRLDDTRVLGIDDPDVGLARLLEQPTLPRVVFIEPDFADIPPFRRATDDHPPADLRDGQVFIDRICRMLWGSRHWSSAAMVITYDEHGGFYDHVAPPGTAAGDPAWRGRVPAVHPDGPPCMGVRVPTFVVSPFVNAASVSHQVLDHTAIIKTILVHNRQRLPSSVFTQFGARVNMMGHLGQVLDDANQPAPRSAPIAPVTRTMPGMPAAPSALPGDEPARDYHAALRRALVPGRSR